MLFRTIAKQALARLFEIMAAESEVIAPVATGTDVAGNPLYAYSPVSSFEMLCLDHTVTKSPAKRYFLPYREDTVIYGIAGDDWQLLPAADGGRQRVIIGLHPCDINALNRLDKVLAYGPYPVSSYIEKRRRTFIVGVDCMPLATCFCRSMGTDTVLQGFDLFITDIGDRYFAEILTARAFDLMKRIDAPEPAEQDHVAYKKRISDKNSRFRTHVDTTDLMKILDMEFQSDVWKQWGDRCLACGSCAQVCPTCYCFGQEETVDLGLATARKTKMLYSCNLIDFATVAGGHNFRPERHIRLKYRYYHKHRGFVEAYEESLCVGCGRCGMSCLAGITVPAVIASVRSAA